MLLFVRPYLTSGCPVGSTPSAPYPRGPVCRGLSPSGRSSLVPQNAALYDGLRSPRELAGTGTRARHRLLVRGFAAAWDSREDSIRWVGHRSYRDGLPRHQPGWGHLRDQCPESRGDHPPAPVRVASDRRCQTWRAGQPGEQQQPLPERRSPPERPGPRTEGLGPDAMLALLAIWLPRGPVTRRSHAGDPDDGPRPAKRRPMPRPSPWPSGRQRGCP